MTDDQAADVIVYALHAGLGQRIPIRDQVLAGLSPADREDVDAACARHRERMAAINEETHRA